MICQIIATRIRQTDIKKREVGSERRDECSGRASRKRRYHFVSVDPQQLGDNLQIGGSAHFVAFTRRVPGTVSAGRNFPSA